jgi:phosphatidylserine/phosphatidylglycerophosphate/cardiolipin synthase-like enzyme
MAALQMTDLDQFKAAKQVDVNYLPHLRTFYSPEDDVHGMLATVIGAATKSVVVNMFGYDDDALAELLAAHLRNPAMFVQISLDKSQAGGVHERAILAKYAHEMTGNSVAIGNSERGAISHRKMVIVDGVWRISGSTNWSTSGESLQDNEATVLRDAVACAEARTVLDITHDHMLAAMAKAAAKAKP